MASRSDPLAAHAAADHLARRDRDRGARRVSRTSAQLWWADCKSVINHAWVSDGCIPNDLDPERFSLRQAAQARDDFAQVMDELDFVK